MIFTGRMAPPHHSRKNSQRPHGVRKENLLTQKITFLQGAKKLFLMVACFTLAVVLLGGVKAAAASTEVTTEQGTFTIGYGGSGYNKYDAPTVIGYKGSESDVTLPTKVTINGEEQAITILGSAFASNKGITSVTIPEGYTAIEGSALKGCTGLTSVRIPGSLTQVGFSAFEGCTSLTTVSFAANTDGTLKFMNKVFYGCTSLTSVDLPIQTSDVNGDGNIFVGCTALKSITVSEGNTKYFSDSGSLYAKNDEGTGTILCTYANIPAELTIPATAGGLPVTAIGVMAFYENTSITSATVPASVTTFGRMCFSYCSNLKTLVLQCETAPTLNSSVFTYLADGSTIYVPNETVAAALEPQGYYTYYTSGKTTVKVGTPSAPAVDASATITLALGTVQQDKVSFDLYLDSASEISVATLKMTLDADKTASVAVSDVNTAFDITTNDYSAEKGLTLYFGKTGGENFSCTERAKLATVTVTLADNAKGSLTATLTDAKVSNTDKQADATISTASVTARILSYDVNGDGVIDLRDIALAQRYYQAASTDENWDTAKAADVNGNGKVDMEDYVALFHAVVAAMGW